MAEEQKMYVEEIRRLEITVTVLAPASEVDGLTRQIGADDGLVVLSERIDSGDLIGRVALTGNTPVPDGEVETALRAIGNDGGFYAHLRRG